MNCSNTLTTSQLQSEVRVSSTLTKAWDLQVMVVAEIHPLSLTSHPVLFVISHETMFLKTWHLVSHPMSKLSRAAARVNVTPRCAVSGLRDGDEEVRACVNCDDGERSCIRYSTRDSPLPSLPPSPTATQGPVQPLPRADWFLQNNN